jgi:exodeoxyribonuclease VII large subunit
MPRQAKSQWEFGELFAPEETRRVLTVSELTTTIRRLMEKEVGEVWVTGEVTNLRVQASGHVYFTLKDAAAQLNCVLFRGGAAAQRDLLQDGQKLLVNGALTVYEPRGQYQLVVRTVELQGVGALQLQFERLKRQLQAEGLFAAERKRPLPRLPRRLGLVTSPTGAALRDVLHVIERRHPALEILLAPCRVQGEGAAAEIAAAIRLLNEWSAAQPAPDRLNLILVTRGGGSLEDLWAFNEEVVARAIFESELPVVSAVGHEIDFTIGDFVADVRAATPSAAAEIITQGAVEARQFVAEAGRRLFLLALRRLELDRDELAQWTARFARAHPRRQIEDRLQRLDELQLALARRTRQLWRERALAAENLRQRLARLKPSALLERRRLALHELARRLRTAARHGLGALPPALAALAERLRLLSPDSVLARGYSITMDAASGRVLRDAAGVRTGQKLRTKLRAGEVRSVAEG